MRCMFLLMKRKSLLGGFLFIFLGIFFCAVAQDYAPPPVPAGQILSPDQLSQMLGPIALYPDPLIAQILPACTQPAQIAIAYSYINSGGDPNATDQQNWDPSIAAVAHYPDVLKMLNDNLAWTTQLGQAYINQPQDVMNAIQSLRAQAQQLGNLQNLPQYNVVQDDGDIEIMPSDPDMLYVPTYDPSLVFYTPCYGQSFITFGIGFGIGGWLVHDFDWHNHRLITWGPGHPRPANWWRATPAVRREAIGRAPVFRPTVRAGARPVVIGRGDRGFAPPATPRGFTFQPKPVQSAFAPREPAHPVEAPREPARPVQASREPARPVEAPREPARAPEVRAEPARPSAFGNESAGETRAASSRGSESRGVSAPAAPARGGGGVGGGGGGRKR